MLLLIVSALVFWRKASARTGRLAARVQSLSVQERLRLASAVAADQRLLPMPRMILPALLLYLSRPVDLVPDFVPVIGQVDDMLALAIGVGLMRGSLAWLVLESHLSLLEGRSPARLDD